MPRLEPLVIGGREVAPGSRAHIDLEVAKLPTQTVIDLPVIALHGARRGPRLFLTATVHGDELNGLEIIRQVLEELDPETLRGTVLAVPIVNVFGFIAGNRYLPDRRDLNRSFPGSATGSLAAALAHLLTEEILTGSTHGIDLHTGSLERANLPQIRCAMSDPATRRMARAFGAPVAVQTSGTPGTLRYHAWEQLGIPTLLFEGGEALRFNEDAIAVGVRGVLNVLASLKMVERERETTLRDDEPRFELDETSWLRAHVGGIARLEVELGAEIEAGERIGVIGNAFGEETLTVVAPWRGVVIGRANNPVVYKGDALVHLGRLPARRTSRRKR